MANHRVSHDLEEDPVVYDSHLDEPLEFEDGTATVSDEATARNLARRHTHLAYDGRVNEGGKPDESDAEPPFDPTGHTVSEIKERLGENDYTLEELDALESAEKDGEFRSTALDAIGEQR